LVNNKALNSTYSKVAIQWLNQALCFYQSLVLRNRQLLVAAKRQVVKKLTIAQFLAS